MSTLAIFGDSFGVQKRNQPYPGWVDLLSQHFEITNYCECGVSEYKILKQLENTDLDRFDKKIIVHTSATRIYVKYNPLHQSSEYHKNCDIILADIEHNQDDFSKSCQLYFKYIFDLDHAVDMHNMICKTIDDLCKGTNVIHTTHFDYTKLYSFPGMINFHQLFLHHRGDVNHYDKFGNHQIYQSILKAL